VLNILGHDEEADVLNILGYVEEGCADYQYAAHNFPEDRDPYIEGNDVYEDCESSNFGAYSKDYVVYEDCESSSFGANLLGFEANIVEPNVVKDNADFGPHGSSCGSEWVATPSPSCECKCVLSADEAYANDDICEAKHENIQDKQDVDVCVRRDANACFITKSMLRRFRDDAPSSLCISHGRPLPIVDSEGESESVRVYMVTGRERMSASNTACMPQRLTVYSRCSTATTVSFVLECDTRAMSGRLTRSVLHGGG
jgi:hypothetical protein